MNLREALLKAGIASVEKVAEQNDAQLFRDHVSQIHEKQRESKRKRKFMRGFRDVYRQAQKNPSVSGSATHEARAIDAAGSDMHRAYVVSGPAVKFGERGLSTKAKR